MNLSPRIYNEKVYFYRYVLCSMFYVLCAMCYVLCAMCYVLCAICISYAGSMSRSSVIKIRKFIQVNKSKPTARWAF